MNIRKEDFENFLGEGYSVHSLFTTEKGIYAFFKNENDTNPPLGSGPAHYSFADGKYRLLGSYEFFNKYEPGFIKYNSRDWFSRLSAAKILTSQNDLTMLLVEMILEELFIPVSSVNISSEDDTKWTFIFDKPEYAYAFYRFLVQFNIKVSYTSQDTITYIGTLN